MNPVNVPALELGDRLMLNFNPYLHLNLRYFISLQNYIDKQQPCLTLLVVSKSVLTYARCRRRP